jgi:hypothetical protein
MTWWRDATADDILGTHTFRNYRIRSLLYAGKPNWELLATVTPR